VVGGTSITGYSDRLFQKFVQKRKDRALARRKGVLASWKKGEQPQVLWKKEGERAAKKGLCIGAGETVLQEPSRGGEGSLEERGGPKQP